MRHLILAILSIFLFSTTADAALTNLRKCRSYVAKVEMDYAKCLKKCVVLQEKGKQPDLSKCDRRRNIGILKAEALYVAKQGVDSDACGLDDTSLSVAKALMLVAAGEDPANHGIATEVLVGTPLDPTVDNQAVRAEGFSAGAASVDITQDNESVCTSAGGNYNPDSGACAIDLTSDNAELCVNAGGAYDGSSNTCSVDITTDNEALCQSVEGVYDSGDNTCFVDLAADNQAVCESAGGLWEQGSCTSSPPSYYDLTTFPACVSIPHCLATGGAIVPETIPKCYHACNFEAVCQP